MLNNLITFDPVNLITLISCAFIVLVGWISGWRLFSESGRLSSILKKLLAVVPAVGEDCSSQQQVIDKMEKACAEDADMKSAWALYKRQWLSPEVALEICQKDFASSRDVAEFFNPIAIFERKGNWRLFRAIPSVLTGLGIFFTFVGLTIGLSGVSGFDDQQGLTQLLDGASLAFCTSIVGLLCSLVFTYCLKGREHRLQALLVDLISRVEWVIPPVSVQQMNAVTYKAVKESSKASTSLNKTIRTFGEQSKAQVSKLITSLVSEFSAQLKGEVRKLDGTVVDLTKIVEKTVQVRDALNEELEAVLSNYRDMSKRIGELDAAIGTHVGDYRQIMQEAESGLRKVSGNFERISGEQAKMLASNADASRQITDTVAGVSASMKSFDLSVKSVSDTLTLSKESVERLTATVEKTVQIRDALNGELESVLNNYRDMGKKIGEFDAAMGTHIGDYRQIMKETESDLQKVALDFKRISDEQTQLLTSSTDVSKRLADTASGIDAFMKSSSQAFKSSADMLTLSKECIDHLNNQGIPALHEMERNFRAISEANQEAVREFRLTAAELSKGAEEMRGNMRATIEQADMQLAGAVDILSKAVKGWGRYQQETAQSLADVVARLEELRLPR